MSGLDSSFRLEFIDALFGNEFMTLTSINEKQKRGSIKVIPMTEASRPLHS